MSAASCIHGAQRKRVERANWCSATKTRRPSARWKRRTVTSLRRSKSLRLHLTGSRCACGEGGSSRGGDQGPLRHWIPAVPTIRYAPYQPQQMPHHLHGSSSCTRASACAARSCACTCTDHGYQTSGSAFHTLPILITQSAARQPIHASGFGEHAPSRHRTDRNAPR